MSDVQYIDQLLLLHAGALGDLVLAMHLGRALVTDSGRQLRVVARNPLVGWLHSRGVLAAGLTDRAAGLHHLYAGALPADTALRRLLADCAVVLSMLGPADAPLTQTLQKYCPGRVLGLPPAADGTPTHIVEQWRGRLHPQWGGDLPRRSAEAWLTDAQRAAAAAALRGQARTGSGPVLIIHPGSGGRDKCAPLELFFELHGAALAHGWSVLWMIGPDELERDGPELRTALQGRGPVLCESDIGAAADLLAGADAFCGNDAGMTHLAAALGLPTAAWFGPTDPRVWAPLGPRVAIFNFREDDTQSLPARTLSWLREARAKPQ